MRGRDPLGPSDSCTYSPHRRYPVQDPRSSSWLQSAAPVERVLEDPSEVEALQMSRRIICDSRFSEGSHDQRTQYSRPSSEVTPADDFQLLLEQEIVSFLQVPGLPSFQLCEHAGVVANLSIHMISMASENEGAGDRPGVRAGDSRIGRSSRILAAVHRAGEIQAQARPR
jgi:hypothetical protein